MFTEYKWNAVIEGDGWRKATPFEIEEYDLDLSLENEESDAFYYDDELISVRKNAGVYELQVCPRVVG